MSLIETAERGDAAAAEALFGALYSELHRLARRELARRGFAVSLGVTTLLHEAYLDIAERSGLSFPDQPRFMKYAASVMRGLIIDHARSRRAMKRGGQFELTSLGTDVAEHMADDGELTRISDALDALAKIEPSLVEVVDLKFFVVMESERNKQSQTTEVNSRDVCSSSTTFRSVTGPVVFCLRFTIFL